MNARLNSEFNILANIFHNDHLQANHYKIKISFTTNSEDPNIFTVAMDRAVYFTQAVCDNAIFVNELDIFAYPELDNMGNDVIVLPDEPSDQIIGLMLFCKLNAIMQDQIRVTDVSIKSHIGGDYEYLHNEQEMLGPFEDPGWWHEDSASIRDPDALPEDQRHVYLETLPDWDLLGLGWDRTLDRDPGTENISKNNPDDKSSTKKDGEVVFVDFGNNPTNSETPDK